uniref:Uncharacterized protein n=1 Tax=Picea sitchensis TaxID=3332 RepID=A0A6B9XRI2_PICSI|nr:hypothetical protein Q903MT_gene4262 [Picea sitchensis]
MIALYLLHVIPSLGMNHEMVSMLAFSICINDVVR